MKDKIFTMLGFAQKSGNLVTGENTVEIYLKKGKVSLLIISEDASENTKKKFTNMCNSLGIQCVIFGTREELSISIGKFNRPVLGIVNKKFSRRIKELIDEINEKETSQ